MWNVTKKTAGLMLSSLALAMPAQQAFAADSDLRINVGVRAWVNSWGSWNPKNDAAAQYSSDNEVSITPLVQARYGDAFAIGSFQGETKYTLNGASTPIHASRKESDIAVGYYVLPSLGVALGYKSMEQKFSDKYTWSGPTLSVSGSAPLGSSNVLLYGSAGFGLMKAKFPGEETHDANYLLSEVGVGYSLLDKVPAVKNLALTAGIRSQVLTTKDASVGATKQDVKDVTSGLVLGIIGSF